MMIRRRRVTFAMLLAAIAGCGGPPRPHRAVGHSFPALPIRPLGAAERPAPTLAGRITLVNFWGPWCPPCRRELPELARLAARLRDDPRFQFVAVASAAGPGDEPELATDVKQFLSAEGLDIDVWAFADPIASLAFTAGGVAGPLLEAFPTTYLIGTDGRVLHGWIGYREGVATEIATAVATAIRDVPAPAPSGP